MQGYSLRESLEASDGNRYSRLGEGHVHKWCFRCEPPSSGTPGAADRSTYYNNRHDAQGGKRKEREKRGMGEHHTTDNGPPTQTSHNRTLLTQRENIEGSHLYNRQHADTAHAKALITHRHMFTVTTRVCASLLPSRKVFYPAFPEKAGPRRSAYASRTLKKFGALSSADGRGSLGYFRVFRWMQLGDGRPKCGRPKSGGWKTELRGTLPSSDFKGRGRTHGSSNVEMDLYVEFFIA